ncbi:FMN dependent dehydrogenase [Ophiocordyceps camponoti-floridani]|uniref:FMN dependent dehydrogenase n=1 Tax=Ophiocordyceps camponoti-floridani TaxID=2030778 RepID=A0A8H4QC02_9HYPO|nr:FMN dependent dehydrogenase [Ophiocordyceps camponoti-floridani]
MTPTNKIPYAAHLAETMRNGVVGGQLPVVLTDPNLLEHQAQRLMAKPGFDYIVGGAGESATVESNRMAFRHWSIVPRVLKPTSPRDLSVSLFGHKYDSPVIMAPVGVQSLYHKDGEIGVSRACAALGVPFTLSTASSTGIEELVRANPQGPKWFQLYWPADDDITASLLRRAQASGYRVLVVTLDTWTLGWRPRDIDNANLPFLLGQGDQVGFEDPVFRAKFAEQTDGGTPETDPMAAAASWLGQCFPGVSRGWHQLSILRKHWDGPMVLKGILSVEDAKLAVEHGIEGIVVSNHGGRQMDGAVATLSVLPSIVDAVGNRTTVMLDSGIRTGADMFKALALGARAVFVGRPVVYGLGIDGTAGAQAVLAGLLADLDLTMGFAGVQKVPDLRRALLREGQFPARGRARL